MVYQNDWDSPLPSFREMASNSAICAVGRGAGDGGNRIERNDRCQMISRESTSHGGTLTLVDISIRPSDYSTHDTPFLSSGLFSRFNLISSTFSNILTSLLANSTDDIWLDDVTDSVVITSSNFDRCNACCTNTLFSNSRFRTLFTLDCSFSHLTLTNEGQQTLSGTTQLIGDVFASISRNGEGGAIQFNPSDTSAVLTVTNDAFTSCSSTSSSKGGAVSASNRKVVVAAATFTECTRHSGGAIATTAAQLTVSDSAFYTCKAICHAWIEERGDVPFRGDPDTPETVRLNGGGGAISCLFESCLAPSFGGGVVLYPYGCAAPEFFRMVICMFLGTTVSTIKTERSGGQIVMIACSRFIVDDVEGYNYFRDELNNQDGVQTKRKEGLFTETKESEAKNIPLGTSGQFPGSTVEFMDADVHVATSGSKRWDCGSSSKRCETVTFAGNKVKTNYKVIVAAGEYSSENEDETCILVNTKIVRIEGAGSSSTSVSFIKPTFFQTANMTVSAGLFSVSVMSLTLINCILKGTGPAIQVDYTSTSSLTHSSSSFTNCKLRYKSKHVGATSKPTAQLTSSSQHPSSTRNPNTAPKTTSKYRGRTTQQTIFASKASHAIRVQSTGDEDSFLLRESDGAVRGHFEVSWQDCGLQDAPYSPPLNLFWLLHASIVLLQVVWLCRGRSDSDLRLGNRNLQHQPTSRDMPLVLVARNRHRLSLDLCRQRHFQFLFLH
ncbi:hypothetical protein BLNAU_3360 [Blattamonas nauphoetae]|uniref:Uncharacterized protein n=1 Tax=Blattamonas nauphoetae TaxID=2049346 RepID=A0ABQ9YCS0_9EUKA|nr:hypothetical protein BLNAU_3360 [Blattamonas nauphoetae]